MNTREKLYNFINEAVRSTIIEENQRSIVREIVVEELERALTEKKKKNDKSSIKRKVVMNALSDPKFNHAQLAYEIGHPKDQSEKDTLRSDFSKKATGKPDNDGVVRKFSDEDINKLYQLIKNH